MIDNPAIRQILEPFSVAKSGANLRGQALQDALGEIHRLNETDFTLLRVLLEEKDTADRLFEKAEKQACITLIQKMREIASITDRNNQTIVFTAGTQEQLQHLWSRISDGWFQEAIGLDRKSAGNWEIEPTAKGTLKKGGAAGSNRLSMYGVENNFTRIVGLEQRISDLEVELTEARRLLGVGKLDRASLEAALGAPLPSLDRIKHALGLLQGLEATLPADKHDNRAHLEAEISRLKDFEAENTRLRNDLATRTQARNIAMAERDQAQIDLAAAQQQIQDLQDAQAAFARLKAAGAVLNVGNPLPGRLVAVGNANGLGALDHAITGEQGGLNPAALVHFNRLLDEERQNLAAQDQIADLQRQLAAALLAAAPVAAPAPAPAAAPALLFGGPGNIPASVLRELNIAKSAGVPTIVNAHDQSAVEREVQRLGLNGF